MQDRAAIRRRSLRRVFVSSLALFGVVFALLTFRLMAGLDPSSSISGSTVAATNTTATEHEEEEYESDDDDADYAEDEDSESDSDSSATSSASSGSATSPAPSTRAS